MSTRFTYRPEYDTDGNLVGTTLINTAGYFAGLTPEQLSAVAEKFTPVYSGGNMSETFASVYYNHMLRKQLNETYKTLDADTHVSDTTECPTDSVRHDRRQGHDN